ncbi:MAG: (2Fe-2S)-binding protein [Myxococcales bacterium]|nr:(2Fe-2S)-binding protein [Myxococcales bacterium]
MSKPRPLLELASPLPADEAVTLEFDGAPIPARAGEPVSAALLRAGVLATTRSPKYRRPRGPYCLRGECGSCQVRIAGQPNLRACTALARDRLAITPQNRWGPRGLDPTGLIDQVFRGGIDHHHLVVRPRIANAVMQKVARTMTGFGTLPDPATSAAAEARQVVHTPTVLVVGAGAAGRRAARHLEAAGVDVLCVDRRDRATLEVAAPGPLPAELLRAGVFAAYPHEGLWTAASDPLEAPLELHTIHPRAVLLATGARDPLLPLANNDLPGVVSARGLHLLLTRSGSRPAVPVVVIGEGDEAAILGEALGAAAVVGPEEVVEIHGGDAVDGVTLKGGRRIACGLVALAPIPAPTHELAAQAGITLRFDGHGFAATSDERGRAIVDPAMPQPWTLWVAGDLRGYMGPTAAAADGEAVAAALLESLEGAR